MNQITVMVGVVLIYGFIVDCLMKAMKKMIHIMTFIIWMIGQSVWRDVKLTSS